MYKALYRKYRPQTFSDVIGQDHVRTVLKRQCETGRISHAYLFCGTRGTGKTTSAKILAKAVNCLDPQNGEPCGKCSACLSIENGTATDVLELDAASNNKVDDIRSICDELIYPPASLARRVYIIDEVHMLTASAYNALLKTLEEPPEHVVFVLATTELNKIPPTILSRCQRFEFRRVPARDIAERLMYVSKRENLMLDFEAAMLISRLADGSVRDGLSLLESCVEAANGGVIDKGIVASQLGLAEDRTMVKLFKAVASRDILACLSLLDEYYASAKSLTVLLDDM
ncbi:MAG: DNA polymerase III subunit gamma/tau, partial [Clostridia bacterium]|nr:DNA polymerase III subunit gamma/tau [Clostridia bacterium]